MLRQRRRDRSEFALLIDPMVDVVFLMLVFFIFSFEMKLHEFHFGVGLAPKPDKSAALASPNDKWTAYVGTDSATGAAEVRFAGEICRSTRELRYLVASLPAADVEIRADAAIAYENVVHAASLFHEADWNVRLQ